MSQYYPSVHPSYVPSSSHRRGYRRRNGYYPQYFSQMGMQGPAMVVCYNSFYLILNTQLFSSHTAYNPWLVAYYILLSHSNVLF